MSLQNTLGVRHIHKFSRCSHKSDISADSKVGSASNVKRRCQRIEPWRTPQSAGSSCDAMGYIGRIHQRRQLLAAFVIKRHSTLLVKVLVSLCIIVRSGSA